MDYEKNYKEALERARALRNEAIEKEYAVSYIKDYETIFPELRESEDERIRGCIGVILTDQTEQRFTDYGVSLKDCLAYLDRQKEQERSRFVMQCLSHERLTKVIEIYPDECDCKVGDVVKAIIRKKD